jgi:hypothetical protein
VRVGVASTSASAVTVGSGQRACPLPRARS